METGTVSFEDTGDVSDLGHRASSLDTKLAIQQALSRLTPKERVVFTRRYIVGQSQTEVAQSMSIAQQRVSQLETAAISKLQSFLS